VSAALELRLSWGLDGEEHTAVVRDQPVVVGRASHCDVVLAHESVSRSHATLSRDDDGFLITDLDSKNGVRVNTFPVTRQRLRDGDRVDLGAVRLHVAIAPVWAAPGANVVFREGRERALATEVIDLRELDALLSGDGASSVAAGRSRETRWTAESPPNPQLTRLLRLFGDAAEALVSCSSLDETLSRMLDLVFTNLPAERGVICLRDAASDRIEPRVTRTRGGRPAEAIEISSHIVNDAIERGHSVLVQDTASDRRFGGADSVILLNIRSAMCAPLYREGRVSGFVYVDRQRGERPFSAEHLQVLSTLALLLAVAVEQAALREDVDRERAIRARLARYSSPAVVDRIVRESGIHERMVADETEVTVLFADLTGFTSLAERLRPAEVVQQLNQIFERLTEVIFEFEGTLDKFRGDGLMAFFGAPLPQRDHAERAVAAALRMHERLRDLNELSGSELRPTMRIGINSGPVVVGDIGSPERKDYTVIGDTVNVASRLESDVAEPGQVVVASETRRRLGERFPCKSLPEVRLRGKQRSVQPWLVLAQG
jgi:adenylate cyclase